MDEIVLIDKPAGWTSFDVVAKVRSNLKKYSTPFPNNQSPNPLSVKPKVGHTGTLDPFATGLLILLTGKECKNADKYSKLDKVYEATVRLGQTSSTGDPEGEITEAGGKKPSKSEVEEVLKQFVGEIEQTPPMYSAIKVNGQRAYKLARKGEKVEIPSRKVTVYSIELIDYLYPELKIRTHVSSGTYIRTLAEDIGKALGTGAYTAELRRTKVGGYDITDAKPLVK
jgi:tRNA pseudouridine55 synthase